MDNLELESLRNKIDEIDTSLCQMIKERQSLASKIMNAKKGDFPFDPDREEKLIKKVFMNGKIKRLTRKRPKNIMRVDFIEDVFLGLVGVR